MDHDAHGQGLQESSKIDSAQKHPDVVLSSVNGAHRAPSGMAESAGHALIKSRARTIKILSISKPSIPVQEYCRINVEQA